MGEWTRTVWTMGSWGLGILGGIAQQARRGKWEKTCSGWATGLSVRGGLRRRLPGEDGRVRNPAKLTTYYRLNGTYIAECVWPCTLPPPEKESTIEIIIEPTGDLTNEFTIELSIELAIELTIV